MRILKNKSSKKTLAINTSSLFLLNSLNFILTIIILPKLINNFGIDGWGQITISQIILNYFIWIIDWSFPQYACKQISIYENSKNKRQYILTTTITSQLILFLISSFLIILYSLVLGENKLIYFYSILILFGNFLQSYCFWYLNGREKIYETAFLQLLNKLIFALFVFKAITQGDDISFYFLFLGLSSVITGIISNLRLVNKYKEEIKIGNIKKSINLIKKSYMLFNSSIIGNITNSFIPFIIRSFYSLENLGLYNIADRIKSISIQILNPLSNSMFPRMSKHYRNDKEKANKKFLSFLFLIFILGVMILLILNLNIEFVINYFLKEKVTGINSVVRILSFSFLVNIIYETFMNQYLVINNLFKDINKIKLLILFSSITLGIPLIYFKGIYGAAITNLIYEIIGLIYVINIFIKNNNKPTFLLT